MANEKRRMKDNTYYRIESWMVNDMDIRSNELLAYAVIHSMSQSAGGFQCSGMRYLASWIHASKNTADQAVHRLINKGLIVKQQTEWGDIYRTCRSMEEGNAVPRRLHEKSTKRSVTQLQKPKEEPRESDLTAWMKMQEAETIRRLGGMKHEPNA